MRFPLTPVHMFEDKQQTVVMLEDVVSAQIGTNIFNPSDLNISVRFKNVSDALLVLYSADEAAKARSDYSKFVQALNRYHTENCIRGPLTDSIDD